jgi:hypothetical protein
MPLPVRVPQTPIWGEPVRGFYTDPRQFVTWGTVIHRGRSVAIGTSEVFDASGKKVAIATGSSVILPGRPALSCPGTGTTARSV